MTAAPYMHYPPVRTRYSDGTATVFLSGELDACTAPEVQRVLREVLDQRPERLVLDLAEVFFIDCAAARELAAASRALPGSRKAVVRRQSRAVRRVLELTGMSACFRNEDALPGWHLTRTPRNRAHPAGHRSRVSG